MSFAQINNARHLKTPEIKIFGQKAYSRTAATSIAITTCNDEGTTFDKPITLAFDKSRESNETDLEDLVECAYYNEKLLQWTMSPAKIINDKIVCETYHLTYFTLLFRNRISDNKGLDITDKVLTIISLVVLLFLIWFNFTVKGWRKLKVKPILRSQFNLALSLIFLNIVYLFGQQWLSPNSEGYVSCAVIAAATQFTICAFFMITESFKK